MHNNALPRVAIIGAGITGTTLALYLSKRGYKVQLYEARERPDYDIATTPMPLDVSERGLFALAEVGVTLKARGVPLHVRVLRYGTRRISTRYGLYPGEYIYTIERRALYEELVSAIRNSAHAIDLRLGHRLTSMDLGSREMVFTTPVGVLRTSYQIVIGCDGINSKVREVINTHTNATTRPVRSGINYTEFRLSNPASSHIDANSTCFWPEVDHAAVTHPLRGSARVSCTLIARDNFDGRKAFEYNKTPFDASDLPQPHRPLRSVLSKSWCADGSVMIMGDAAHAMLPFLGQGVNCCLEDCTRLNAYLNEHGDCWETVMPIFEKERSLNASAISDMSSQSASEILYGDGHQLENGFQAKVLEQEFAKNVKGIIAYSYLLRFTRIPYSEIYELKRSQDELAQRVRQGDFDLHASGVGAAIHAYTKYQDSWLKRNEQWSREKLRVGGPSS